MPYNMNTVDINEGPPPILADCGSGGERHSHGYRHQWTPTHLLSSSSSSSTPQASSFNKPKLGNNKSNIKGARVEEQDEEGRVRSTYPMMFGTRQALSSSLEQSDAIHPAPPVIHPSSHFSLPQGFTTTDPISAFEQQEKVKVRLVENRGLVVEEPGDDDDNDNDRSEGQGGKTTRDGDFRSRVDTRASYSLVRPSSSSNAARKNINCLKYGNRTTCPGHSSKIASSFISRGGVRISPPPFPPPPYFEVNEQQGGNNNCGCGGGSGQQHHGASSASSSSTTSSFVNPFSKSRLGSGSAGVSSLTPLMTGSDHGKDNHKIPVVVRSPSSSFKQAQGAGGSNIHLYCALVLGFSASLFFSLTLLLAKVLKNRDHHPISIAFWRYLGVLATSVPLGMIYIFRGKKNKVVGSVWPIHDMDKAATALALLMRGVLGSTAVILRFCSLKYLTIGDASVISYCAPVFAGIFAPFCVRKDKGGLFPILVGLAAAFGIFLVCQPPFLRGGDGGGYDSDTLKGVFLVSLSMLCTSGVLIVVRNLLQKVHFSLMMFVLGIWGVFEAGVLALSLDVLKVPELLPDIVMMFGVAILTFFGQLFVLLALRMGQVGSAVSVMRSCDIFFSFLWQYLFLKTEPELYSILGAILIISAVWFICFRKWLITLRENHSMRQRLSLMLY